MKNTKKSALALLLVICMIISLFTLPISAMSNITDISYSSAKITSTTNNNPLSYAVGDQITFNLTLKADGNVVSAPYLSYKVIRDDGVTETGYADCTTGTATVTTTIVFILRFQRYERT